MDFSGIVNFNDITTIFVKEIKDRFEKQVNENIILKMDIKILETENKELKNSIELLNYRLDYVRGSGKCSRNV